MWQRDDLTDRLLDEKVFELGEKSEIIWPRANGHYFVSHASERCPQKIDNPSGSGTEVRSVGI